MKILKRLTAYLNEDTFKELRDKYDNLKIIFYQRF